MIKEVEYIDGYRLLCTFDDGQKRLIDLGYFFTTCALPGVKRYAPLDKFKTVRVDYGTIAWGDNECDINPLSIYWGEFEVADSPYWDDIRRTVAERDARRKAENMKRAAKRKATMKRNARLKAKQAKEDENKKINPTKEKN